MIKIFLLFIFSLISIVFLAYYNNEYDWETIPTKNIDYGTLSSSLLSDFTFNFSNYSISFSSSNKFLKISSERSIIFSNVPNFAFLYCAIGYASSENSFGMWFFEDKYDKICKNQIIEQIEVVASDEIQITGYFSDCTSLDKFKFSLKQIDDKLQVLSECSSQRFNRSLIVMSSNKHENVYGFGEHSGQVNMKGEILSNFVRESGTFRNDDFMTFFEDLRNNHAGGKPYYSYYPAPLFLTSDLRGGFVLNDHYNIFDMTKSESIKMMFWSPKISLYLFDDASFPGLISKLTKLTGRMKPLPDWIMNGGVVAITGGSEKLRSGYERLKKFNSSLAGIWSQDWSGKRMDGKAARLWWNWQIDNNYYPDWQNMTEELMRNGVKRLTYINPMLHNITGYLDNVTNFFEIAAKNDYLLKDSDNNIIYYNLNGFKAGLLDFTNDNATEFYKKIIKQYMFNESKTYGFMADFGEDIPIENIIYKNPFAEKDAMHNVYPYNLPKVCSEAAQEYFGSNDEIVFFTRSGNKLSPQYTRLAWAGDQLENWQEGNGIKSAVKAMLNLGLSGAQLSHSDVGGYIDYSYQGIINIGRTEELLQRWIELGAFSVVMRTHEGTAPDTSPQVYYNDKMAEFFSRFTKIYVSWKEYRVHLMKEGFETGLPVLRHMMIHYVHDHKTHFLTKQFLIGEDLLIAPVLDEGVDTVNVYFPYTSNEKTEEWIHLWSNEIYTSCSCWRKINAPIGKPAIFYKMNSEWGIKMREYLIDNKIL